MQGASGPARAKPLAHVWERGRGEGLPCFASFKVRPSRTSPNPKCGLRQAPRTPKCRSAALPLGGPALHLSTPPLSSRPERSGEPGSQPYPARITIPILRSRPAWVCVSKDEGGAGPDGQPMESLVLRDAMRSRMAPQDEGCWIMMLTIFLYLPSCVHSSPKRGRFRSGLWRGGEAAPAPVEYHSAVPGGLLKAAWRSGLKPCARRKRLSRLCVGQKANAFAGV